jgi:hypothetical protein
MFGCRRGTGGLGGQAARSRDSMTLMEAFLSLEHLEQGRRYMITITTRTTWWVEKARLAQRQRHQTHLGDAARHEGQQQQ